MKNFVLGFFVMTAFITILARAFLQYTGDTVKHVDVSGHCVRALIIEDDQEKEISCKEFKVRGLEEKYHRTISVQGPEEIKILQDERILAEYHKNPDKE